MKRSGLLGLLCSLVLAAVLAGGSAWAGGISLYEFGSPDVGLAAAGYAARAQDASTVFTNPAGMSRLEKSQVLGGLQALYGNVEFSPGSATTVAGSDGGTAVGWIPGGSLFVVQKLNPDWSVGFGVLSYFGLAESYDDNWVGRYYVQKSTLIGLTLTPAVSYRVNNWLSVGAGLNIMYGYVDSEIAINNIGEARPDGSEVKLDFSAVPEFSGLGPVLQALLVSRGLTTTNLDLSMTVPQMVMFSAYHEINEKWAVMGNVGWQNWSRFGQVDVGINSSNPTTLTTDSDYNDTWHVALGAQYRHSPAWTFTCGVAYDSSAVDDDKRSVVLPMGEAWRFALGAQYAFNQNLTLGAAYEFLWTGDMAVDQNRGPLAGRVAGDYSSTSFSFFALNLKWTY